MNNDREERLYNLLPAIYRIRDSEQNGVLRALLGIIEQELEIIETDIENLYENWFIETCDEWVVPYIGDLLDANLYSDRLTDGQERRAYVANTLAYRARKGTAPVLEQLVADITGWRGRVVEFFQLLATTQNINNIRPENVTVDLRRAKQPEMLGTPFERNVSYTTEVRRITTQRGRYNIPNIGIFIWRLASYPIKKVTPRLIKAASEEQEINLYTFSPLGNDIPLFNRPQTETEITTLAQEVNLPGQLRRETLQNNASNYFSEQPVLQIVINNQRQPIPYQKILFTNLSNDQPLPNNTNYSVAVDPELGRLAFFNSPLPENVEVSYSYGFSGDIGGGSYDRSEELAKIIPQSATRVLWDVQQSLVTAVQEWNKYVRIWEYCQETFYIPLQHLTIDRDEKIYLSDRYIPPKFQPGIVSGLTVTATTQTSEAIVSPGIAVDPQGQRINLDIKYRVNLKRYAKQTVLLTISYRDVTIEPKWQIKVIPESTATSLSSIPLARIQIDSTGKIKKLDTGDRLTFHPGILEGLEVKLERNSSNLVSIASGKAIDSKANLIKLNSNATIDKSFLNPDICPVWLLYITPKGSISTVPNPELGIITLKDNHTYQGNLTVKIPAAKHLLILAANECRPHLYGNLSIKGVASSDTDPGELTLNGLLLEGKVTVLTGNLKKLAIAHCTLVPNNGGLTVEQVKREVEQPQEETNDFSFAVAIVYFLSLIAKIIQLGVAARTAESKNSLAKLFQIALRRLTRLFSLLQESINQYQLPESCSLNNQVSSLIETGDNDNLTIVIDKSICGAVTLADTVPSLAIADSIIDKGKSNNNTAIAAIGTNIDINRTTIFGKTTVRSLETSDSIFNEKVTALRRQAGCIRFCFVPHGSQTPRRFNCQPDLVLQKISDSPTGTTSLTISPQNGQLVVGTAGKGIFRFDENSSTWTKLNNGLSNLYITALLTNNSELFAGATGGDIFHSTDNGTTWTAIGTDSINADITFLTAVGSGNNNFLFAGTASNGIFRSQDNGKTWKPINTGLENPYITTLLVVDASKGELLAVTPDGGVFRSQNYGDRWTWMNRNLSARPVTALAINEHTAEEENTREILAGTGSDGIFYFDRDFQKWKPIDTDLTNTDITLLATYKDTEANNYLLVGTSSGGIFILQKSGKTWKKRQNYSSYGDVTAFAINTDTKNLFAATSIGVILRSQDNGNTWLKLNQGLLDIEEKLTVLRSVQPNFTSTDYGNPSYSQLSQSCAVEIRTGAENSSEMGVFNYLKQPQRETSLRASINEYLPFGLDLGIFYEN